MNVRSTCASTRSVFVSPPSAWPVASSVSAQSTVTDSLVALSRDGGANEIERSSRSAAPLAQRAGDRVLHHRDDAVAVAQPHVALGGMNVRVDLARAAR